MFDPSLMRLGGLVTICVAVVLIVWILRARPPRALAYVLYGISGIMIGLPFVLQAL